MGLHGIFCFGCFLSWRFCLVRCIVGCIVLARNAMKFTARQAVIGLVDNFFNFSDRASLQFHKYTTFFNVFKRAFTSTFTCTQVHYSQNVSALRSANIISDIVMTYNVVIDIVITYYIYIYIYIYI